MKPSIFEIMRSIQRLPLSVQYDRLGELLADEPRRSIMRGLIEKERRSLVIRDLNAGNRGLKGRGVA